VPYIRSAWAGIYSKRRSAFSANTFSNKLTTKLVGMTGTWELWDAAGGSNLRSGVGHGISVLVAHGTLDCAGSAARRYYHDNDSAQVGEKVSDILLVQFLRSCSQHPAAAYRTA
jgi:hypothetical protein